MRDGEIHRLNQQRAMNEVRLYKALAFVDCRLQAIERLSSSPWQVLLMFLRPKWFWKSVDAVQVELMKEHDEAVKKAAEDAKKEAQKPKIDIVSALNGR